MQAASNIAPGNLEPRLLRHTLFFQFGVIACLLDASWTRIWWGCQLDVGQNSSLEVWALGDSDPLKNTKPCCRNISWVHLFSLNNSFYRAFVQISHVSLSLTKLDHYWVNKTHTVAHVILKLAMFGIFFSPFASFAIHVGIIRISYDSSEQGLDFGILRLGFNGTYVFQPTRGSWIFPAVTVVSLDKYFCASSGSYLIFLENIGLKTQFPIPFYSLLVWDQMSSNVPFTLDPLIRTRSECSPALNFRGPSFLPHKYPSFGSIWKLHSLWIVRLIASHEDILQPMKAQITLRWAASQSTFTYLKLGVCQMPF